MAMPDRALPFIKCPLPAWRGVTGVLTDIDDTLTRDGHIEPVALQALHQLAQAHVPVVAITGRPLGWSQPFAHAWPLAAIVAENGAVALIRDGLAPGLRANPAALTGDAAAATNLALVRQAVEPDACASRQEPATPLALRIEFVQDEATRQHNFGRLKQVAANILAAVPGAKLAEDSAGRATDIAIDHSEFAHLNEAQIAEVVALMQAAGMKATVSSIHINGWFGAHTKWTGAQWIVPRLFGQPLDAAQWVYVGDSTNDQEMFARFPLSVGVANLRRFEAQLHTWPAFITEGERGAGFAEVARALLAAQAR